MKTITINEKEVEIPTGWENITFEKFNSFSKLINSQITQEEWNKENEDMDEEVKSLEWSLHNIRLNTKLACFWSGLSEEEISLANIDDVEEVLKSMEFINNTYVPIPIDYFRFNDVKYLLPNKGMQGENFGTFIEAEQVEINNKKLEKGDLSGLPKQIAILCRAEGEERGLIDDKLIEQRVQVFQKLDMATIWDVGFFLTQQENSLMTVFLTYLRQEGMEKLLEQQRGQ